MNKYIVLIPAYEPDDKLITLVENLKKENVDIIVVNDGSNKSYDQIFDKLEVKVISYYPNMGKGYALKEGYRYIKNTYLDDYVVVTMDSDGQHDIKDALNLCDYASKDRRTLYIGKRKVSRKTPIKSRLGNTITRYIYYLVSKTKVYDTQTGLRAFSNQLINFMINVEGNRYEYEMNVLLECPLHGIKIKEIDIKVIYIDNNSRSHFNPLKDSFKIYKEIFKYTIASITSFIIDYLLYVIFNLLTNNIILSNIFARIISGTFNFTINKNLVFKSDNNLVKSFIEYVLLAIMILTLNTILLSIFVTRLHMNRYIMKIIVELILFIISWFVQKVIIFKKGEDNTEI